MITGCFKIQKTARSASSVNIVYKVFKILVHPILRHLGQLRSIFWDSLSIHFWDTSFIHILGHLVYSYSGTPRPFTFWDTSSIYFLGRLVYPYFWISFPTIFSDNSSIYILGRPVIPYSRTPCVSIFRILIDCIEYRLYAKHTYTSSSREGRWVYLQCIGATGILWKKEDDVG